MAKITKYIFLSTLLIFAMGIGAGVFAQGNTAAVADEQVSVSIGNLGVSNPSLLPDSPFYFIKEWTRNIKMAFTFNNIKKATLENTFSNERLVELKKLSDKGANSEIIKRATEKYQSSIDKIKELSDEIKEKAVNNEEVNKFLEKFTNHQVLQEKILQKLASQVPQDVFEKIKQARENHLEKFGQVMQRLEDRKDEKKCQTDSDCPKIYCIKAPCPQNTCIEGKCKTIGSNVNTNCIPEGSTSQRRADVITNNCCPGLKEEPLATTQSIPGSILFKCIKPTGEIK